MQRLKRSFTFGGRGRRRNAGGGDDDKEKKRKSSLSHDAENGTENPDALPPKTDAEALKDAKAGPFVIHLLFKRMPVAFSPKSSRFDGDSKM